MAKGLELTVVAPAYNEQDTIVAFLTKLRSVLEEMSVSYEVIIVDDGSRDQTQKEIAIFGWSKVRLLTFPVNLGHQAALDFGYRAARGNYVITIDADLQHPPEMIPVFYKTALEQQVDIVYGFRKKRNEDGILKRITAKIYYSLIRLITNLEVQDSAADFRLISKKVVMTLRSLPAGPKVFRLLIPSLGFASAKCEFTADKRYAGKSKYSLSKMLGLATSSVVSFSIRPLFFSVQLGLIFGAISIFGLLYTLVTYLNGGTVPGWASTSSAILLMFAINFLVLGVFGMYLGELIRSSRLTEISARIENTLEE